MEINEIMTYDQLLSVSSDRRKDRADNVKYDVPPNFEAAEDDNTFVFKSKSVPSETGHSYETGITFFKPKNSKLPLERTKCKVDCSCFGPDALVLMSNGTYRPIKEISIGDKVYTHTGKIKKVTNNRSFSVDGKKGVYEMSVTNFPGTFIVTGDHPFYTLTGNKHCLCGCGNRIDNVRSNPHQTLNVKFKKGHQTRGKKIQEDFSGGRFEWTQVSDFRKCEWFLSPFLSGGNESIDVDMCRLLGYYLAEGFCCRVGYETRFSLNKNEEKTLASDIKRICDKFNFESWFVFYPKSETMEVRVSSKELRLWLLKHGGRGSYDKIISDEIMSLNNECLEQVVLGMFLGDGCFNSSFDKRSNRIKDVSRYASCSWSLISQTSTILNKLKISYGITKNICEKNSRGFNYAINVSPGKSSKKIFDLAKNITPKADREIVIPNEYGIIRDEGNINRLKSIKKIDYVDVVYDLTVEDDESFIVHGVAVHNCPDYKYTWAFANKKKGSSDIGSSSLNKATNQAPKVNNPRQRTGLCKHLIAIGDYIDGELYKLPPSMPTNDKLGTISSKYKKPLKPLPGADRRKAEIDKIKGIREELNEIKSELLFENVQIKLIDLVDF